MKRGITQLVLLCVALALGLWTWRVLFPSPDQLIRKKLIELAQLASFNSNEAPLAKAINSQKMVSLCTPDVEISIDTAGRAPQTIRGQNDLGRAALAARSAISGLSIEFLDVNISVDPDKRSATVDLTAKGRIAGDSDLLVQELKIIFKKIGGSWLITRVETIKALSQQTALYFL
nr:hypothetical protein Hi04_10k_c5218_00025 [uncultured bacterium]